MPKIINPEEVEKVKSRYAAAIGRGLTHKKAITAIAEELEMPRRRISEWAKRFDWEKDTADEPETREAYIRRVAAAAQVSETVIENALRVQELEEAGEIPEGTMQQIIAGQTTPRKVLNAYDNKQRHRNPEHLQAQKITLSLTKAEIDATLAVLDGSETQADQELMDRAVLKFFAALRTMK